MSALQQPFYSTEVLTELIKKTEARFRVLHALASETEAAAREKAQERRAGTRETRGAFDSTPETRRAGARAPPSRAGTA